MNQEDLVVSLVITAFVILLGVVSYFKGFDSGRDYERKNRRD